MPRIGWVKTGMSVVTVFAVGCLLSTSVRAEDSYLCAGEQATGFGFNEKNAKWNAANLTAKRWIVKVDDTYSKGFVVLEEGAKYPASFCGYFDSAGNLLCQGFWQFRMNRRSLRFISAYLEGYWNYDAKDMKNKEGESAPSIEIGNCSKR